LKTFLNNIVLLSKFSGILLVFAVILIIPQINIQEYVLPTITSKLIYFLYASMILLSLYSITIIFSKVAAFSFSKIDIALFVLVLYITLNRYFIQSHYGFSIRYIELLGLSFLYVVLRSIGLKNHSWLLLCVVFSGIMQAVYGNLQLLGYYPSNHSGFKMTGSFFNPGPYAGFLVSVWAVALGMYLFKEDIIKQIQQKQKNNSPFLNEVIKYTFEYIPLLGIISISIVLPALQSRASWIAVVVSSLVLLELRYSVFKKLFKKANAFKKTIVAVLFLGIVAAGLFGVYIFKKRSSDGRAFIWKVTTEMIIDHPIFGLGFDRFNANYMNYQAQYFERNGETPEALVADNTYYAFNEVLQLVSENGFIGLVLLLTLIYVFFQTKIKEGFQLQSFIAKTALLSIGIFACFSYPMQILPIKIILIMALALLACLDLNVFELKLSQNSILYDTYKISFLLFSLSVIINQSTNINILDKGFKTWKLASEPFDDYETVLKDYETAYPIFKNQGDFLMGYGKTLSLAGKNTQAITILEEAKQYLNTTVIQTALGDAYKETKQYKEAEKAYQDAHNMSPSKFYPMYLLVKLYDESNNEKKAVEIANNILNKKIKIPSTAIKEIREEMKKILIKYKNT
jgi:O-antigen polymerase